MRAVALAAAVVAAFIGVMYARFSGDTVPEPKAMVTPAPAQISILERCERYSRFPRPPQCGNPGIGYYGLPTVPPTPVSPPNVRERPAVLRAGSNVRFASALARVAFVREDDIWVKYLKSGAERRLTEDGRSVWPKWSSDGRWVAVRKKSAPDSLGGYRLAELWIVSADGQAATKIADDASSAAWSPVEPLLAYTDGAILFTFRPGIDERRGLVPAGNFAWSPDGISIAFDWSEPAGENQLRQGLSIIAGDGSGARRDIYQVTHQFSAGPIPHLQGWSGDGRYLSFWQAPILSASLLADGTPLFVIPVEGGEPQELGRTLLHREGIISWSPNGARIAFVNGGGRDIWVRKHLVISDLSGAGAAFREDDGTAELNPAWSPQGDIVAFSRGEGRPPEGGYEFYPEPAATRRIWLGDSTGRVQQLTFDHAYSDNWPLWSNDGSRILFVRISAADIQGYVIRTGAVAELWLMNGDGSEQRKVLDLAPATLSGYYGFIHWDQVFDWYRG